MSARGEQPGRGRTTPQAEGFTAPWVNGVVEAFVKHGLPPTPVVVRSGRADEVVHLGDAGQRHVYEHYQPRRGWCLAWRVRLDPEAPRSSGRLVVLDDGTVWAAGYRVSPGSAVADAGGFTVERRGVERSSELVGAWPSTAPQQGAVDLLKIMLVALGQLLGEGRLPEADATAWLVDDSLAAPAVSAHDISGVA